METAKGNFSLTRLFPGTSSMVVLAMVVLAPHAVHADYYKYTDKTGVVCITNTAESVPPIYRATVKVIREETLDRKDRASRIESQRQTPVAAETASAPDVQKQDKPAEPASAYGRLLTRFPWSKPVLIVSALFCIFLIIRRLSAILPSAQLARLIYIAFFLGAFVFVYKSYAEHLANSYASVKTKIVALFEQANRREMPGTGEKPLFVPTAREQSPR